MNDRQTAAGEIRRLLDALAHEVTDRQFAKRPQLVEMFGSAARARCVEDARFHWSFLAAAIEAGVDTIFVDYIAWAKTVLLTRNVPESDLQETLRLMADIVRLQISEERRPIAIAPIEQALAQFDAMPRTVVSSMKPASEAGAIAKEYLAALLTMDSRAATRVIADALARGLDVRTVSCDVLEPVQQEIGRLWQLNEISVAVEHFCSSVTHQLLAQLGAFRGPAADPHRKRVITMCAPGELHEIGLRAIAEILSLDGWHTIHLGANVPAASAVRVCAEWKAEAILISASLPPHVNAVTEVIRQLRAEPSLQRTRILVGGRVFTNYPQLWRITGADGSASNAAEVARLLSNGSSGSA